MKLSDVIQQSAQPQKLKLSQVMQQEAAPNPVEGMSGTERWLAGAGAGMTGMVRGGKQAAIEIAQGLGADKGLADYIPTVGALKAVTNAFTGGEEARAQQAEQLRQEQAQAQELEAPLMATGTGRAGNVTGMVASALPTMFIPGANTYTGAALVGAGTGFLQPTADENVLASKAKDAAIGAGAGVAGQVIGQGIGAAINRYGVRRAAEQAARAAANAERDATLAAGQAAGYVAPPAATSGNMTGKILNGLSGKAKTEQLARIRNQRLTDRLSRQALHLGDDIPITEEVLQAVRGAAYNTGYAPVARIGNIATDDQYIDALNAVTRRHAGAIRSFPQAAQNDVAAMIEPYRVQGFLAEDALSQIQVIRDAAGDAFRTGNTQAGRALRELSGVIEDQIERHLTQQGQQGAQLLGNFREARRLIARAHTVDDALLVGTGNVDARKFGAALQRGAPLDGELELIGRFANAFPESMTMPKGADANPLTVLDFTTGGIGAGLSASNPLGLAVMALPAARVASRYGILSQAGQNMFTQPNYGPNLLQQTAPLLQSDSLNALLRLAPPSIYAAEQ